MGVRRIGETMKIRVLDLVRFMAELNDDGDRLQARGIYKFLERQGFTDREIYGSSERFEVDWT